MLLNIPAQATPGNALIFVVKQTKSTFSQSIFIVKLAENNYNFLHNRYKTLAVKDTTFGLNGINRFYLHFIAFFSKNSFIRTHLTTNKNTLFFSLTTKLNCTNTHDTFLNGCLMHKDGLPKNLKSSFIFSWNLNLQHNV